MSNDSYCNACKTNFELPNLCACFDGYDREQERYEEHCAERLAEQYEDDKAAQEFRDKLKSINFSKVK